MLDKKETQPKRKFDSTQQTKTMKQQPNFHPPVNDTDTENSSDEDDVSQLI